MPGDDGRWLHDNERGPPVALDSTKPSPQEPVGGGQLRPFCSRALEHSNLVAKCQVLEAKSGMSSKRGRQRGED